MADADKALSQTASARASGVRALPPPHLLILHLVIASSLPTLLSFTRSRNNNVTLFLHNKRQSGTLMTHTRAATNNSLVDCHFFITKSCDKGDRCGYRHSKASLRTTIVCPKYTLGECEDPDACEKRHPLICKHDRKAGGCTSISCPFHHLNPCTADGTRPPPATPPNRSRASTIPSSRMNGRAEALRSGYADDDSILQDMMDRMRRLCSKHGMPAGIGAPDVVLDAIEELAHRLHNSYQEFLRQRPSQQERNGWFDNRWIYIERNMRAAISHANHPIVRTRSRSQAASHHRAPILISRQPVAMSVPVSLVPDQAVRRRARSQTRRLPATGNATANSPARVCTKKTSKSTAQTQSAAAKSTSAPVSVTTADLLAGALRNIGFHDSSNSNSDSEIESFEHDDSYFK